MIGRRMLTDEEKAVYEWQIWVPEFGDEGQEKLKGASVLISRVGGLGSVVAYELAAAGVGRLVLAHGGNVKPSDLNRQLLMTHDWLGKPRVESAARRLRGRPRQRWELPLDAARVDRSRRAREEVPARGRVGRRAGDGLLQAPWGAPRSRSAAAGPQLPAA